MPPIFVSFYTPGYADEARQLVETLDLFGLDHDVRPFESLGAWEWNISHKPKFIRQMIDKYPRRSIVWLDADARVRRRPELFDVLPAHLGVHFSIRDTSREPFAATIFVGDSEPARALIDEWAGWCGIDPDSGDQRNLGRMLRRPHDYVVVNLPRAYCAPFDGDLDREKIVIEQMQVSRHLRFVDAV